MSRFRRIAPAALACSLALNAAAGAAELPLESYRFTGVYYTQDTAGGFVERRVAEFTPIGPIAGTIRENPRPAREYVVPPLRPTHVAVDPRASTYYGRFDSGIPATFDRQSGTMTSLPDREISHPTGLAFDTARNRLVVSTLGGEGALLAYSPDRNQWSTLASLNGDDIYSLTYSAGEDAFYGYYGSRLLRYDAQGRPTGAVRLSLPPPSTDFWGYQLIATGDRLALLTDLLPDPANPKGPKVQFSYLIDPSTGATTALGPVRVVPEPGAAAVLFGACATMGLVRRRARRKLSDPARE